MKPQKYLLSRTVVQETHCRVANGVNLGVEPATGTLETGWTLWLNTCDDKTSAKHFIPAYAEEIYLLTVDPGSLRIKVHQT